MLRVGIPILFNEQHWMGGINYFRSLISAFSLVEQDDIELIIFCEKSGVFNTAKLNNVRQVIIPHLLSPKLSRRIINKIFGVNIELYKAIKNEGVDILSHAQVNKKIPCKTMWWKPDFQEKYYPEFFSEKDLFLRNQAVVNNAQRGCLLFSSNDAKNDFFKFYNGLATQNINVLQFVPEIITNSLLDDSDRITAIKEKYRIIGDYFFLPNQFWKHKNHELVIKALITGDIPIQVVATGAPNDYRGGEHIKLINRLLEQDSGKKFKLLGLVDRDDVNLLMKGAMAVINPSRFEGWSTTVEEAKYLGKRLILSDIPVHHEQNPPDSLYVQCDDVSGMISAMHSVIDEYDAEKEIIRKMKAVEQYKIKRKEFGVSYYNILKSI
ncbi:glycosyltransferase [Escherichia albertii]|uniref:glycosyltransferase n=1 Tax=Escherichia albertii TaxID=208962 RepID=UPI000CF6E3B8|nr:glycosyltransferase [Escherichia albertii]EJY9801562.1 glycosyltransferase [Escherichia albertii]MCU7328517.1 glycosyltransferase [Escherichia albertii]MCU7337581.1 glycosyltransferase [Escherichia albertii]MCU7341745.1 glycosyltransferase [Escherichia albertii]MCU7346002.1 glycosyltransferase [Escherichia albertii]